MRRASSLIAVYFSFCPFQSAKSQLINGDINCPLQCYNGGICSYSEKSEFSCNCPPLNIYSRGFGGIRCETPFVICDNGLLEYRCWNDSTCDIDNNRCKCSDEFSGTYCEIGPVKCLDGLLCFNGATCREWDPFNPKSLDENSSCRCLRGYTGEQCEIEEEIIEIKESTTSSSDNGIGIIFIVVLSVGSAVVTSLLILLIYQLVLRKRTTEEGDSKESEKTGVEEMNASDHSQDSTKKGVV